MSGDIVQQAAHLRRLADTLNSSGQWAGIVGSMREIADELAGLLVDPAAPVCTAEQADVIEAAIAETKAEAEFDKWRRPGGRAQAEKEHRALRSAQYARRAAVDRLAATEEPTHRCPPEGSGVTPCCGRTPFEISRTDRMTEDEALVNCDRLAATKEPTDRFVTRVLDTPFGPIVADVYVGPATEEPT